MRVLVRDLDTHAGWKNCLGEERGVYIGEEGLGGGSIGAWVWGGGDGAVMCRLCW